MARVAIFVLSRCHNPGACLTVVPLHIIFSLDEAELYGCLQHVACVCGIKLLWEIIFFFSSFYSNVNLETVARGLFSLRMIYQSSGGTEIFYK
jgi:hypothetical protein